MRSMAVFSSLLLGCQSASRSFSATDQRQVEQDLIINRALVEIFADAMRRDELRFHGGPALDPDRSHRSSSPEVSQHRPLLP